MSSALRAGAVSAQDISNNAEALNQRASSAADWSRLVFMTQRGATAIPGRGRAARRAGAHFLRRPSPAGRGSERFARLGRRAKIRGVEPAASFQEALLPRGRAETGT
jgi:hypothetical protein